LTDDFDVDELDGTGAIEPSASQRGSARVLYSTFVALVQAGFTDEQALAVVVGMIHSVDDVIDTER